jgi:uncharacterized protein
MRLSPPLKFILLLLLSLFSCITAADANFPAKPKTGFIVDEAKLLDLATTQKVQQVTDSLWHDKQVPLVVVTIPSLLSYNAADYTIEKYATALFNHWGIGSQERNYGILLLISKGDRKARIELGKAYGTNYNSQTDQVMNKLIIPQFKSDHYTVGILDGVRGLDAMARGLNLPEATPSPWAIPLLIGSLLLAIAMIVSLFRSGRKGFAWLLIAGIFGIIWYIMSSSRGGNDGGFGGGSSDGGGGSSGSW